MLNLPLFSYHTYELISVHTHASIPCRDMINIYKLTGFSLVFVSLYAKQKHPGCKKRRGQSEAAVIK